MSYHNKYNTKKSSYQGATKFNFQFGKSYFQQPSSRDLSTPKTHLIMLSRLAARTSRQVPKVTRAATTSTANQQKSSSFRYAKALGLLAVPTALVLMQQSQQRQAKCATSDEIADRLAKIEKIVSNLDPTTKLLGQIEEGRTANVRTVTGSLDHLWAEGDLRVWEGQLLELL